MKRKDFLTGKDHIKDFPPAFFIGRIRRLWIGKQTGFSTCFMQMILEPAKILSELIALPSVNPAFLSAGNPLGGESRPARFLADLAGKAGLSVEWQPVLPGRSNLIVRLTPGEAKQRVILAPHLDTVGCDDMPQSCFEPVVKGGRLHGRGACDTKGSAAAMFTALCAVAASGRRPAATEIVFAGLVDEENAQEGSRAFAASEIKGGLAIVGEPTELKVVTAHKGDLWLKVVTRGVAAHGSRPELGDNAALKIARVIVALETKYAAELSRRKHPVLGSPTINVGVVRGGTQPNIVPDYCEIEIDRRTIPGEEESTVVAEILGFLKSEGIEAEWINAKLKPCDSLETDPDLPLVRRFLSANNQHGPLGVDYFCDAAIIAKGGTPSVVFGPGNIAQAHTADEWIEIASLEGATRILTNFLRDLP